MASARARSSYPSPPPEEVAARCYADLARHLEPAGAQEDEGADARMCAPTSSALQLTYPGDAGSRRGWYTFVLCQSSRQVGSGAARGPEAETQRAGPGGDRVRGRCEVRRRRVRKSSIAGFRGSSQRGGGAVRGHQPRRQVRAKWHEGLRTDRDAPRHHPPAREGAGQWHRFSRSVTFRDEGPVF